MQYPLISLLMAVALQAQILAPSEKEVALKRAAQKLLIQATKGRVEAQTSLGKCYAAGLGVDQNPEEAVKWYRMAAVKGDFEAQYLLGLACDRGMGIPQDHAQAVIWYRKAAEPKKSLFASEPRRLKAEVHAALGNCLAQGRGTARNWSEAARWYRKAAELGHPVAQCSLGVNYEFGLGVPQDYLEAVHWYRLSALQGHADAQFFLGRCYQQGVGVTLSHLEAYMWFNLATAFGHAEAAAHRDALTKSGYLEPREITKAQSRASRLHREIQARLNTDREGESSDSR